MSDSENELPSDEEDDDYVPSGEDVQEEVSEPDDSGQSDEEDEVDDDDKRRVGERQSARLKKTDKKTAKSNLKRGRTRRGVTYGEGESNGSESAETPSKKTKPGPQNEEEEKKRVDDLWASFLSDVNQPKAKLTSKILVQKGTKVEVEGGDSSSSDLVSGSATNSSTRPQQQTSSPSSASSSPTKSTASEKITITKVFDFAGEEIKVTKEVSLDSEEAKEELAKREADSDKSVAEGKSQSATATPPPAQRPSTVSGAASPSAAASNITAAAAASARPSTLKTAILSSPSGSGAVEKILNFGKQKTPTATGSTKGGLANIMDKISGGPKKKMTVLDKTALDWKNFKDKEGISEELATFNKGKGGFLEKQKFLQQTDYRQYEAERNMRLGKR